MSSISVGRTGMYTAADRVLRNIPNAISLARLLATPVLLWMVLSHRQELFKWLLLACLLSDILDGWIARAFDVRSKRGTSLDSLADLLVALNIWSFRVSARVSGGPLPGGPVGRGAFCN
jgi:phosphatidylglycerophosphate synthase